MAAARTVPPTQGFSAVSRDSVPQRTAHADRLPIGAMESSALTQIDGESNVGVIADRLGIAHIECATLIARLVDVGCATIDEGDADDASDRLTVPSTDIPAAARVLRRRRR
jgi:hypothetical protein